MPFALRGKCYLKSRALLKYAPVLGFLVFPPDILFSSSDEIKGVCGMVNGFYSMQSAAIFLHTHAKLIFEKLLNGQQQKLPAHHVASIQKVGKFNCV